MAQNNSSSYWVSEGQILAINQFPSIPDYNYEIPAKDMDGYNFSIYPQDLLDLFGRVAIVQLSNHAPSVRDDEIYKDWVFIGSGPSLFKIKPNFKSILAEQLEINGYSINLSSYPTAFIEGSQVVTMAELCSALEEIGCDAVRVQAYGMKAQINSNMPNLGNPEHPLASSNFFDLGRNFKQPHICLVKPNDLIGASWEVFPMLIRLSDGYGSLKSSFNFRGMDIKLKIYPLLVHRIKAIAGKQILYDPKTIRSCRVRETNLLKRYQSLSNFSRLQLGGLRLEVTLKAHSLDEAKFRLAQTPLLNINEYIQPTREEMRKLKIRVKFIRIGKYFRNFQQLLHKAQELGTFKGDNNRKPGKPRKMIISDLFNAMGWNPGTRSLTTSLTPRGLPWWEWEPLDDIDKVQDPNQSQTSLRSFLNPHSDASHFSEIERCVKIIKRKNTWVAMVLDPRGRAIFKGSENTKAKIVKYIWEKYARNWSKVCYLSQEPWIASGSSRNHRNLQEDLIAFKLPTRNELPATAVLVHLQGTSSYLVTQNYIIADGNCQFRALSWAYSGSQRNFKNVRRRVIRYLQENQDLITPVLGSDALTGSGTFATASEYLNNMAKNTTWGDDMTLSTAIRLYKLNIIIINPDKTFFKIQTDDEPEEWHAFYYTGNHYEIVVSS